MLESLGQLVTSFTHVPNSLDVLQRGPLETGVPAEDPGRALQCGALCRAVRPWRMQGGAGEPQTSVVQGGRSRGCAPSSHGWRLREEGTPHQGSASGPRGHVGPRMAPGACRNQPEPDAISSAGIRPQRGEAAAG